MNDSTWINNVWKTEEYIKSKQVSFELIDSFLNEVPKNILDIGCGLAFESEMFQKKYKSNLYLLDGDFETTVNAERDRKFGSANTMAFYSKILDLQTNFDKRKMKYTFIDANNINIPKNLKFDLIYSNVSCGFHYPLSTYYNVLKTHSDEKSLMIFDIHTRYLQEQLNDLFEIIETKNFSGQKKLVKCRLKIKK
jgi:SAM-dependent methyltransferase